MRDPVLDPQPGDKVVCDALRAGVYVRVSVTVRRASADALRVFAEFPDMSMESQVSRKWWRDKCSQIGAVVTASSGAP